MARPIYVVQPSLGEPTPDAAGFTALLIAAHRGRCAEQLA